MSDNAQIGRILHYVVGGQAKLLNKGSCVPAIVTREISAGKVNLKAWPDEGQEFSYHLREILPDHISKTPNTWHWPRECEKLHETT